MNKKWNKFDQLTEKCYMNMIGAEEDNNCWIQAYEVLREIITEERKKQPDFALELYQLDEDTDYQYDVQGWLQDCIDELDMREERDSLLSVINELLELFQWKESSASEFKAVKSSVLSRLGRADEAADFCKEWIREEPDNIFAIAATIYASIAIRDMEKAEALIKQHIKEDTECTEDNDILFTAASTYYQVTGNKKEQKRIDKEIKKYEKFLEDFYMGDAEEDFFDYDEELPFN